MLIRKRTISSSLKLLGGVRRAVNESSTTAMEMFSYFKDDKKNHLFEESVALNVYDKTKINMAAGCPGPDLLQPLSDMMIKATEHRMNIEKQNNYFLFQYGPTAGLWNLREALAGFLSHRYGSKVYRENLLLTCGATHGLHVLISTLLAPNGIIFVEEYTYMIALELFGEFPNFQIQKVPLESDGVNVEKFNSIVAEAKQKSTYQTNEKKLFWAIFYTIPNFHNPTGSLLSPEKCKAIVKSAKTHDVLVVCDDVYNLLYYGQDANPPPRLFSYDDYKDGNVVSNGSFSKILAPGMRVGWLEIPIKLMGRFKSSGVLLSGGSVNNVMFGIIQSFIELGFAGSHLDWYTQVYTKRMDVLCNTLEKHLPAGCKFDRPQGGYFVWIEVPFDDCAFLKWSMENGGPSGVPSVRFTPKLLSTTDEREKYAVRLSIGFHDAETIEKAAMEFCKYAKQYDDMQKKK